jgi:hypothetical protein
MKTLYISALFLIVSILFISCAKEEIVPEPVVTPPTTVTVPEPPATIIGVWEYSKQVALNSGVETLIDFPHTVGCPKNYFIITPNGSFLSYSYSNANSPCGESLDNGKYVLNDKVLTVTGGFLGFVSTYKILSITKQEMKVTVESTGFSATYVLKRL